MNTHYFRSFTEKNIRIYSHFSYSSSDRGYHSQRNPEMHLTSYSKRSWNEGTEYKLATARLLFKSQRD